MFNIKIHKSTVCHNSIPEFCQNVANFADIKSLSFIDLIRSQLFHCSIDSHLTATIYFFVLQEKGLAQEAPIWGSLIEQPGVELKISSTLEKTVSRWRTRGVTQREICCLMRPDSKITHCVTILPTVLLLRLVVSESYLQMVHLHCEMIYYCSIYVSEQMIK